MKRAIALKALKSLFPIALAALSLGLSGCKTKGEIRREQEYERIKQEVREARGARADLDVISEEFRTEISRLGTALEEQGQQHRSQMEELRRELAAVNSRVQSLEQHNTSAANAAAAAPPPKAKTYSYDTARHLFEEQEYDEAAEEARGVVKSKPKNSVENRKAHYLLAEALFAARDFSAAALEFSEFKKQHPKDVNVALATLRLAQSFKNMGKEREAKLFYQEVIERYPKSSSAAQAKKEVRKLR